MKTALVLGGTGFIGHHMVRRLKHEGYWVRCVDIEREQYANTEADDLILGDLTDYNFAKEVINCSFDEIYQFAADMGGAGYVFTGDNDAEIMANSAQINLNVLRACDRRNSRNIFYSSSACIYPARNQVDPEDHDCSELSAYPAEPDSNYGWEKLFSERMFEAFAKNHGFRIRIARYHNIFGPEGAWNSGKEKAPAAICRKIANLSEDSGEIEVWGDGQQTRSFLYIDECIEGTRRIMNSDKQGPYNVGAEQHVTINGLVKMVAGIAGKDVIIKHIPGPQGVRGRSSNNNEIYKDLGWKPTEDLESGLKKTYEWIFDKIYKSNG